MSTVFDYRVLKQTLRSSGANLTKEHTCKLHPCVPYFCSMCANDRIHN